jgi:hypothetical protein
MKLYFSEDGKLTGSDARVFAPDGPQQTVELDPAANAAIVGCLASGRGDGMRLDRGVISIGGITVEQAAAGQDYLDARQLPEILERAGRSALADGDIACVTRVSVRRLMEIL